MAPRFSIIPARAGSDERLSDSLYRTLGVLGSFVNHDTDDCYPGLKKLGSLLHKARQNVSRDLHQLEQLGYIKITPRYSKDDRSQTTNLYYVIYDEPPHQDEDEPPHQDEDEEVASPEDEPINVPYNVPEERKEQPPSSVITPTYASVDKFIFECTGMPAIPASARDKIDQIYALIEHYGYEVILEIGKQAYQEWRGTRAKDGHYYRPTNLAWIDRIQDKLLGQPERREQEMTREEYYAYVLEQYRSEVAG